jgi:hypothetical protein
MDALFDPWGPDVTLTVAEADALLAYVQHPEEELEATKPPELTPSELSGKVSQLQGVVVRGIERFSRCVCLDCGGEDVRAKFAQPKLSCKTNSAVFSFEGICAHPRVLAAMLGVEDVTKFKTEKSVPRDTHGKAVTDCGFGRYKYTADQFQDEIMEQSVRGSARYKWAVGLRASGTELRHQVVYGGRRPSDSPGARGASRVIVSEDRWSSVAESAKIPLAGPIRGPLSTVSSLSSSASFASVSSRVSSRFFFHPPQPLDLPEALPTGEAGRSSARQSHDLRPPDRALALPG